MTEPSIIDYYNEFPNVITVIEKMNEEYEKLRIENEKLKKENEFLSSIFEYPLRNNAIFNLVRLKKKGEDVDSFLKRLCSPKGLSRNDYKDLVVETFLKGHSRYSHLN